MIVYSSLVLVHKAYTNFVSGNADMNIMFASFLRNLI